MKALVVEDEPLAQEELKRLLKPFPDIQVIGTAESVSEAVDWLENNPAPDLIFLDVQLADGLSFEIFEQVECTAPVIFTTAYDEYALRAFRLHSIDYLLKPIEPEALSMAIGKFSQLRPAVPGWNELREILAGSLKGAGTTAYRSGFTIRRGDRILRIETEQIAWFRAEDDTVWLMERTGKEHIVDHRLEQIEAQLDPKIFFRINRAMLVRMDTIKQAHKHFNGRLKLDLEPDCKEDVMVSRARVKDFLNWFDR